MSEYDQEGKKETVFLMEVASLFTRGNLTGQQGLAVIRAAETLLRESKKNDKKGGMYGTLAALYEDEELPVPLIERVLVVGLTQSGTFWRENLANYLERVLRFVERETTVDLTKPWRSMLAELLRLKSSERMGLKQLKAQTDLEDIEES